MAITTCKLCKRPIIAGGIGDLCDTCLVNLDEAIIKIKDYLSEHPRTANMVQVSEATGVGQRMIQYMLKTKRIEFSQGTADGKGFLTCEICGKSISEGRFCKKCVSSFLKEVKGPDAKGDGKGGKKTDDETGTGKDKKGIQIK